MNTSVTNTPTTVAPSSPSPSHEVAGRPASLRERRGMVPILIDLSDMNQGSVRAPGNRPLNVGPAGSSAAQPPLQHAQQRHPAEQALFQHLPFYANNNLNLSGEQLKQLEYMQKNNPHYQEFQSGLKDALDTIEKLPNLSPEQKQGLIYQATQSGFQKLQHDLQTQSQFELIILNFLQSQLQLFVDAAKFAASLR